MERIVFISYEELCYGSPSGVVDDAVRTDERIETRTLSLRASTSLTPQEHEEEIALYLQDAPVWGAMACVVNDVIDSHAPAVLFPGTKTDGRYVWPAELYYYVRKYHVVVPADLVTRMASLKWRPPLTEDIDWNMLSTL